ncbi:dipeptidase E [Dysgonomonas sp. PH5-45]|uniref:dipeptidase PepE n=1 Tax=unclassified Dysgonomonas TaxID=2630389 RepID=UPI0024745F75|nr:MULTISPECIES: dipeptidase PepE [unclassified Dysgonomonas]MDH6354110.1 dipeptidase E [Dysgonomonas sp. PH5-45]MDH6387039.1 dipeptidase E [Dysgonomonas sp. PH5-37]
MKLLLLSNSTNPGESYLGYPKQEIKKFLGEKPLNIVFIPYAAIRFSYDEYERRVNESLGEVGIAVKGIHRFENPIDAINNADAICVGGGNTWKLVRMLHDNGLMPVIKERVMAGVPYIGWSAGSNIACPTLRTTNDMPIIDPKGFDTIGLVPFQINPHYLDVNPANHGGETREDRIMEFITEDPNAYVVGLRESTMLHVDGNTLKLIGSRPVRIFKFGEETRELTSADDFNFLMK